MAYHNKEKSLHTLHKCFMVSAVLSLYFYFTPLTLRLMKKHFYELRATCIKVSFSFHNLHLTL